MRPHHSPAFEERNAPQCISECIPSALLLLQMLNYEIDTVPAFVVLNAKGGCGGA